MTFISKASKKKKKLNNRKELNNMYLNINGKSNEMRRYFRPPLSKNLFVFEFSLFSLVLTVLFSKPDFTSLPPLEANKSFRIHFRVTIFDIKLFFTIHLLPYLPSASLFSTLAPLLFPTPFTAFVFFRFFFTRRKVQRWLVHF